MAPFNTSYQNLFKNMSSNGDFDYQSLISQFGAQGLSKLSGGKDFGAGWFLQALQSGDTTATFQAAANFAFNIFADMGTNDVPKANQQNDKDSGKINDTKTDTKELFASVDKSLQTIMDSCESNQEKIQTALDKIEELGGDKGVIQAKRNELEEKVKFIKKQQEKLNNPDTKPEDRPGIIKAILGAVGEIKDIADVVTALKSQLEAQQTVVDESSKEVESLSQQMETVVDNGTKDVEKITEKNMEQMAEGTQKVADSVGKKALGTEQVATGTAMVSALVSGSEGAQLIASGTSKIAGGAELMTGAVKDFKEIDDIASNLQTGTEKFKSFAEGIGKYSDGIKDLVGAFSANINPMIESIGSWETVKTTNIALGEYTVQYAQDNGMQDAVTDFTGSGNANNNDNNAQKQGNISSQAYEFDMSGFDAVLKVKEAK